ncbi:16S rRNA (cytidine(1402)-2'-O)-methyltransferase [Nitratifractor salsuginis]|uniref:Ribosomal RNA small subunit methyltransferase I n=1 Tax=Nitratifractor salsuginis (strain DSM 16511 / JCM 12458 / E9I37-1) TaxID=749222 RepID=E6X230_NITSE|nr:16S rRNA (cytidine(1402)-2'-O)-methyltransferase [Nitratifractor salsuginis]ADV47099.1 Uroporphyrin-III C/tetrapyrrole (Corrin/Porphyrin) methyltransferase [Nitratifractor salsuginis DSM 16511]
MLTFVPTPLGNLQDITYRSLSVFESATLFLCEDTRVTRHLLELLHKRGLMERLPEADFLSFNEHNGPARLDEVGTRLEAENVVYVSDAGMPAISDPGQLLVRYCQEREIAYDVLPGPSAVTVAYAASGFESGRFLFYGFLPHKGRERREALEELLRSPWDSVLYEAPHRLERLLEEIVSRDPDRELFAAKELSKKHQRYYRGSARVLLERLRAENAFRGEWVVIIAGAKDSAPALYQEDIRSMDLPPKVKAKLLAKLLGGSVSQWYQELCQKK